MNKSEHGFLQRNLGPLITAIVPVVAVIVSAGQIWVAHIAKEKEIAINQEKFDHQMKQDLVKFVTENEKELFSSKESERGRIRDIISVAFPPEITEQLFKKLEATVTDEETKETWRQAQEGIERIRRNAVTIQYFSNDQAGYKDIGSQLRKLGFNVTQKGSKLDRPINSIWFGEGVHIDDIKLIATTLLNANVGLKSIRPLKNPSGVRANLVQIGSDASKVDSPSLTAQQISEANEFTR